MTDSLNAFAPRPGSSLALALRTAGPARQALGHWLAWWHSVSAIAYTVSDPTVAERKLAWWVQAVASAHEAPVQKPPQHPLLKPLLAGSLPRSAVPPLRLWLSQLQGQQQLTQQTRWLDDAGLRQHMHATTGAACAGAAWLLGATDDAAQAAAHNLGVGLRRAHILFRLGQDARAGWLHLPIDCLQRHEVRAHEWLRPAPEAPTPAMLALLDAWQAQACDELHSALAQMRALPRVQRRVLRPLVVLASLSLALLADVRQARYPVLRQRLLLGPWRKLWVAQKASWR